MTYKQLKQLEKLLALYIRQMQSKPDEQMAAQIVAHVRLWVAADRDAADPT